MRGLRRRKSSAAPSEHRITVHRSSSPWSRHYMYKVKQATFIMVIYSSPNIVRVIKARTMRWAGHVARMGERSGVYKGLVRKPKRKKPLGRSRRRWEDNIKMDLKKVGRGVWTGLSWLRIGTGGGHL